MKGSAVLVICEIAKGAIDLYCDFVTKPWDTAAAKLIVEEAGGVFWNFKGENCSYASDASDGLIIGNKEIAKQFIKNIKRGNLL